MRIEIYDCGEHFADRYEVLLEVGRGVDVWRMSENADWPNGMCYYSGHDITPNYRPENAAPVAVVPVGVARALAGVVAEHYSQSRDQLTELATVAGEDDAPADVLRRVCALLRELGA